MSALKTLLFLPPPTRIGFHKTHCHRNPRKLPLNWQSPLTHVDITHAPDAAYEPLKRHYDEKQIANLTYAIALMNAWNRVGIGFQLAPQPCSGHHSA
jgi:alkylhydroperoxidase family enzyme